MQKITAPSGFPENLPEEQIIENKFKRNFAEIAELYGYLPLETPAVEYLDTLSSKGPINKEIYLIDRALGEGEAEQGKKRALRFDLTVPLARYVGQHYEELIFPFRRYQIQKVWRGERAQKGRFREFYQADVDVIANANLPLQLDVEVLLLMATILSRFIDSTTVTMRINNRKFLSEFLAAKGVQNLDEAIRILDKIDKVGTQETIDSLAVSSQLKEEELKKIVTFVSRDIEPHEAIQWLGEFKKESASEGAGELECVFNLLIGSEKIKGVSFVFSPKIARGLDYYTGTICETTIDGLERYGSICSGGRYADLAERFINRKLPGVGMSIGLSRLLDILKSEKLVQIPSQSCALFLMGTYSEDQRTKLNNVASKFRKAGFPTETIHDLSIPFQKQRDLAHKKNITLVFFEKDDTVSIIPAGRNSHKVGLSSSEDLLDYVSKYTELGQDRVN